MLLFLLCIFLAFSPKIQVAVGTRTYDSKTLMLKTPHTSVTGRRDMKLVLPRKLMTRTAGFFFGCNSGMNFREITIYFLLGFLVGSLHKG